MNPIHFPSPSDWSSFHDSHFHKDAIEAFTQVYLTSTANEDPMAQFTHLTPEFIQYFDEKEAFREESKRKEAEDNHSRSILVDEPMSNESLPVTLLQSKDYDLELFCMEAHMISQFKRFEQESRPTLWPTISLRF